MTDIERLSGSLRAMRMRDGRGPGARKSLAGQAMVLFVVLIGVLCLAVLLLFNTGQVVNKKVRLTNAADAAAYSVAVQQARVMNYAAYMNRGRIANEVAIAQIVSLWSWSNMLHTHMVEGWNVFEVLATSLAWVPILGQALQILKVAYQAGEAVMAAVRLGLSPVFQFTIPLIDGLNGLLATSANLMLESGQLGSGWQIADEIVKANDSTASVAPLGIALLQQQLMHAASDGSNGMLDKFQKPARGRNAGMDRYRNLVMASRDEFSADRSDDIGIPVIDIETRGGTDMVEYDRWAAQDTLDLSIQIPLAPDMDIPLGWGGAMASPRTNPLPSFRPGIRSGGTSRNGNGWYTDFHTPKKTYRQYGDVKQNSITGKWANQYPSVDFKFAPHSATGGLTKKRNAYVGSYNGLRAYQDVKTKYGQLPEGENAGPIFSVFVESAAANARTAQDAGLGGAPGSRMELRQQMDGNKMTAIASSQVYFNRPPAHALWRRMVPRSWNANPQADNQLEMGSLFSPYWQARLVETPRDIYTKVGIVAVVAGG